MRIGTKNHAFGARQVSPEYRGGEGEGSRVHGKTDAEINETQDLGVGSGLILSHADKDLGSGVVLFRWTRLYLASGEGGAEGEREVIRRREARMLQCTGTDEMRCLQLGEPRRRPMISGQPGHVATAHGKYKKRKIEGRKSLFEGKLVPLIWQRKLLGKRSQRKVGDVATKSEIEANGGAPPLRTPAWMSRDRNGTMGFSVEENVQVLPQTGFLLSIQGVAGSPDGLRVDW
ncbi:hypothetical protein FB45DRAFT_1076090 [Roridomyces roridus]|uniref:Uncharacterized protein n=1 Tax=Roridomyces roridus TaxID=1738132 RepID=A0AAD7FYJ6_9AGAR|nr:hypothetical protein FB45DRAFT_1076090 [Roridomyces roridus]